MTSGIHISCNIPLLWHFSLNMHIHRALIGVRQSIFLYMNPGTDALLWLISLFLTHSHRDHRQTGLLRLREDELTVTVTAQVWTCTSREASCLLLWHQRPHDQCDGKEAYSTGLKVLSSENNRCCRTLGEIRSHCRNVTRVKKSSVKNPHPMHRTLQATSPTLTPNPLFPATSVDLIYKWVCRASEGPVMA